MSQVVLWIELFEATADEVKVPGHGSLRPFTGWRLQNGEAAVQVTLMRTSKIRKVQKARRVGEEGAPGKFVQARHGGGHSVEGDLAGSVKAIACFNACLPK